MPTNTKALQVAEPAGFIAGKNKIINGDFGVWQRGTSITVPTATTQYTADRYYIYTNYSAGTATFSQQSFTLGTAPVAGYEGTYFGRLTCASTTTYGEIGQKIEDVRLFAGQTVTFSFWAKASTNTTLTGSIFQDFGSATGGSTGVYTYFSSTLAVTTSWQRFTSTITVPSIAGKTLGTTTNLRVQLTFTPTNSQTIDFWGMQLEAGSVATPFTTATGTIQGELAACQRYYYQMCSGSGDYIGIGTYWNSGNMQTVFHLPVSMRSAPTLVQTTGTDYYNSATNGGNDGFNSFTIQTITKAQQNIVGAYNSTEMAGTAGYSSRLVTNNASASLALNSEL